MPSQRQPERRHKVLAIFDEGFAAAWPETAAQLRAYFQHHAQHLVLVTDPVNVLAGEAAKNDPAWSAGTASSTSTTWTGTRSCWWWGRACRTAGYAAATAHQGDTHRADADHRAGTKRFRRRREGRHQRLRQQELHRHLRAPYAVISDFRFLERLPHRDAIAGMAEAVKVSLIRDGSFFAWLEAHAAELAVPAPSRWARSSGAELHLTASAPAAIRFEQGSARPLDFGHWAAHKLEALTHKLRHEAVAIGLVLDSRYSVEAGLLPEADFNRIERLIGRLGLPRWHDALLAPGRGTRPALFDGLDDFREHLGGDQTITLLRGIGRALDVHEIRAAHREGARVDARPQGLTGRRP